MPTIFSRIIEGDIPGVFVWRDDLCVAFLSINPLKPGHVLVVPRAEIDHWLDCPPDIRDHLIDVSQTIGRAIAVAFPSEKVGLMIAGLEVPHLHIHLVPIDRARDLDFANAATSVEQGALEVVATAIRDALVAQGATGVSA
jgi:histidine triad (HIT) family protein